MRKRDLFGARIFLLWEKVRKGYGVEYYNTTRMRITRQMQASAGEN